MNMRVTAIVVGLALAAAPGFAHAAKARKPAAAHAAAHHVKAAKAEPKGKKPNHKGASAAVTAAIAGAYAAMSEADRRAIQADLAFVGVYDGAGGGDFDEHTIAAVKAFQQRNNERETGILTAPERDLLAAAAKSRAEGVGWRLIEDIATGARLGVPEKLVPQSGATRIGARWNSAQGQIRIETFRLTEASLPALFEQEKKTAKRHVAFSLLKPDAFLISGEQSLKNFVVRAEARGSELRGVSVFYDQATAGIMGSVAAAIANTFAGFPDPNARPPGLRQTVEYGSAIAVDDRGDLVASADVTDGCQAIIVPGLGHAERAAADKTNGLALLHLYGARNLVGATVAGESDLPAGDVTLVGVADPLGQAGGGAVTKTAARAAGQNIEPPPQFGFSGAAVVDAKGRLIGIVELEPMIVAGAGFVGRQATLVPVATIRSFLQAHGVVPVAAGTPASVEQSVLRVICVRK